MGNSLKICSGNSSAFNLWSSIDQTCLFYSSALRVECIFLSVNNACSNPVFGFISCVRAEATTSPGEHAASKGDLWVRRYESRLFLGFDLFQNLLRMPNTLERCHNSRAITFCRLIAFCTLLARSSYRIQLILE